MRNAIILHGSGCSPADYWIPWLTKELEAKDYSVWAPQLPETENPRLDIQLPFVLKNGSFTKDTIIIGHSSGCPLILAVLEALNITVKQAILVAGFLNLGNPDDPILKKSYEWDRIRSHVNDLIFINSDDDPWGCNHLQGEKLFEMLGGTLIIRHGEGHMGSTTYNQPYREFPLLAKLVE